MVHIEHCSPILRVEDMTRSLAFYVGLLCFENAEWGGGDFTCVTRGGATIYLRLGDQGRGGAWAWLGVDDATQFHAECLARGVPVRMAPRNFPWALEMQLEDPDGNVLLLGSEPLPEA
ncbi:MAG: bleomycin resistance family protein [Acidobacteria bacterium]|nr:bleomycin resistance family protein [Acidobacteriota bacterium]